MTKYFSAKLKATGLLLCAVGLASCGSSPDESAGSSDQYRKVVIDGTMVIGVDPSKLDLKERQGMVICTPSADYMMQFYFPMEGGEAVKEHSSISLAGQNCMAYGDTTDPCTRELSADSFNSKPFTVGEVSLTVDEDFSSFTGVKEPMDQLLFRKEALPILSNSEDFVNETMTCGSSVSNVNKPGFFFELLAPFAGTSWSLYTKPGQSEENSIKNSIIPFIASNSGMSYWTYLTYSTDFTLSEVIVSSLEE